MWGRVGGGMQLRCVAARNGSTAFRCLEPSRGEDLLEHLAEILTPSAIAVAAGGAVLRVTRDDPRTGVKWDSWGREAESGARQEGGSHAPWTKPTTGSEC